MLSFLEYLLEAEGGGGNTDVVSNVKFARGKDDDFFYNDFRLVTFDPAEFKQYKVEGKTAGIYSHACKHLDEIDESFVSAQLNILRALMKKWLKNPDNAKDFTIFSGTGSKRHPEDPVAAMDTVADAALINFLDLVNDKYVLNKPMNGIEKWCIPILKALGVRYAECIKKVIDSAEVIFSKDSEESVDDALEKNTIRFTVCELAGRRAELNIYIDFKRNLICMQTGKTVLTMFVVGDGGANKKQFISKIMRRYSHNWHFYNKALEAALLDAAKK